MSMIVFIDDSGDPGFKLDRGSSRFFVITAVIFEDELEIEKTAVAIKELRRKLSFPDTYEFKFFKSRHDVRLEFLKTIAPFEFKVRSIVVDKTLIRSNELKSTKESFYSYFIKNLLQYNKDSIKNARIKIDGSGDRVFRKSFEAYLRQQLNTSTKQVFVDLKMVDSKNNVMVQMADMIAGTVKRSQERQDGVELKEILRKRVSDEWQFH
mgnify:FL=1